MRQRVPGHILHVTTELGVGGSEMMMLKLATNSQYAGRVLALLKDGPIGSLLRQNGIATRALALRSFRSALTAPWAVNQWYRICRPNLIQGWLYDGNLLASALGTIYGVPVVWNVRQSVQPKAMETIHARLAQKSLIALSRSPVRIIYNSHVARAQHEALGLPAEKGIVIPNGFDTQKFRPSEHARAAIRNELGIPSGAIVVGQVGRNHRMKGHELFILAAKDIIAMRPDVHFLVAGAGVDSDTGLMDLASNCASPGQIHLLGQRLDVERVIESLDIACSSSKSGEGFSNTIGEAMSCGVPCVATDVGDSKLLIGETGIIVPPSSKEDLISGILELIDDVYKRKSKSLLARQRILENYSIDKIVQQYDHLYASIIR